MPENGKLGNFYLVCEQFRTVHLEVIKIQLRW